MLNRLFKGWSRNCKVFKGLWIYVDMKKENQSTVNSKIEALELSRKERKRIYQMEYYQDHRE